MGGRDSGNYKFYTDTDSGRFFKWLKMKKA